MLDADPAELVRPPTSERITMYLENHEEAFADFLAQNASFWTEHGGAAVKDGCIYVDLAHDNPAYLLTNLWIAKYLQRQLGARVVGLTGGWPKSLPHFNPTAVRRLAESFLVDEVRELDAHEFDDPSLSSAFAGAIEGLKGKDLRRAVLSFGADVDPDIGWVLYDSWIRQERVATLEHSSDELLACARWVIRARRGVQSIMAEETALATVVGHYHYSPYAWMARESVAKGAPVYFQSLLLPVSVRRFATLQDFRRGRGADFVVRYKSEVLDKLRDDQLEPFRRRMFDVQSGVRQFFRTVRKVGVVASRDDALRELGLDPSLPTVGIYAPALCGPPHCFGPLLFDDNGDWLTSTLAIAGDTPAVNFLVKAHPQDATYDTSGLVVNCAASYGMYANIRFLGQDSSPEQVAVMCDLAVTISGTPGYELAAQGVPTLAAGPSRYSDLGFCIDVTSLDAYRAWLSNPQRAALDAEQAREALAFMFFEMFAGRSQSLFLPQTQLAGSVQFWSEAARRLRACLPEEDPLWRNLSHMLSSDLPFLLNVDVLETRGVASSPRTNTEVALAGLHAIGLRVQRRHDDDLREAQLAIRLAKAEVQQMSTFIDAVLGPSRKLQFGIDEPGNSFLRHGWSGVERGGVWTDGGFATIDLPQLPQGVVLVLECVGFISEESPERVVSFRYGDGLLVDVVFRAHEEEQEVRVSTGAGDCSGGLQIFIRNPSVAIGGERKLGLWLKAIGVAPGG